MNFRWDLAISRQHSHLSMNVQIANEGLLRDFLRAHSVIIDWDPIIARCQEGQERACRVSVAETTIVPAGTWTIIEGRAMKPLASGSWVVEPLTGNRKEKILIAKAVKAGADTLLPIEVMNPLQENVFLYKHTQIGMITRLPDPSVICFLSEEGLPRQTQKAESTELTEELNVLMDKTEVEVDQEQRQQIRQL